VERLDQFEAALEQSGLSHDQGEIHESGHKLICADIRRANSRVAIDIGDYI